LENKSAIHGVAVDDSAFVAPRGKSYTVLHLTTSSNQGDTNTSDEIFVDAMGKAVEYLIASQTTPKDMVPIKEFHHVSFSYAIEMSSSKEEGKEDVKPSGQTTGLHVCYRDGQSLTCDSAFREAKRIFEEICPESDFLAIAKKVEDAIVYRDAEDSDDEKLVLESACTMIQAPATETPSSEVDMETSNSATAEKPSSEVETSNSATTEES